MLIDEGSSSTIVCEAVGYPPPTVIWNRDNGTFSDRVSISSSVSTLVGDGNITRVIVNLTINASREDTGVYTCSASNFIGSDSSNVSITVQCKLVMQNILLSSNIVYYKK